MNIRRILCVLLVVFLFLGTGATVVLGTELENAQQKQQGLVNELNNLNNQLATLSEEMNQLEVKLQQSEALVEQLNEEMVVLEAEKEKQYESMKLRIQYTYENSDSSVLEALLESETLAEFVSRAEYFAGVIQYDRKMMENYKQLIATIEENKATVLAQKEQQQQLVAEVEKKQAEVIGAISNTKQSVATLQGEIDDYIARLEENETDEDIGTQEPEEWVPDSGNTGSDSDSDAGDTDGDTNEGSGSGNTESSESDLMLLAAIIECEAVGEPYEGKIAVGSVVMNRIASSKFPNTMVGVIYQKGQFSPVATGKLAAVLARGAKQNCIDAARDVLNGSRNVDCLFFRVNDGREGIVIGNHVFY